MNDPTTDEPTSKPPEAPWSPWAWRCTEHRTFGHIKSQTEYEDHILFVFPKHWRQGCIVSLWPLGRRHLTRYLGQTAADAPVLQSRNRAAFR